MTSCVQWIETLSCAYARMWASVCSCLCVLRSTWIAFKISFHINPPYLCRRVSESLAEAAGSIWEACSRPAGKLTHNVLRSHLTSLVLQCSWFYCANDNLWQRSADWSTEGDVVKNIHFVFSIENETFVCGHQAMVSMFNYYIYSKRLT